jgi:hypothetical protein
VVGSSRVVRQFVDLACGDRREMCYVGKICEDCCVGSVMGEYAYGVLESVTVSL